MKKKKNHLGYRSLSRFNMQQQRRLVSVVVVLRFYNRLFYNIIDGNGQQQQVYYVIIVQNVKRGFGLLAVQLGPGFRHKVHFFLEGQSKTTFSKYTIQFNSCYCVTDN